MLVVRPVTREDVPQLLAMAAETGFGLTTLPRDEALLARRVNESLESFAQLDGRPPRGESFLLVLEDTDTQQIAGTSGLVSKVGGFEPFYAYRIDKSIHSSEQLGVHKEIATLHLVAEHNGPCEIGSLFLRPEHRRHGNGRLLSLSRFVLIAEHAEQFDPMVIAEMRGVIDERGGSPFWDALGRHFFDIDFPTADYLSVVNKKFIADLMPRHPIYIPLLPTTAQAVIGQVHIQTKPALALLESEGFTFSGMVDIFEAGPVMRCPRDRIRAVRDSRRLRVADVVAAELDGPPHIIATVDGPFRACRGTIEVEGESADIEQAVADALGLHRGDTIRVVGLYPKALATDEHR